MPKLYSPEGVTCTLSYNFDAANAGVIVIDSARLQRHQKLALDVIAVVIRAGTIQIGISRPKEAAEAGFICSASLCHHHDVAGRNLAAFLVAFGEELALRRTSGLHAHPRARNHRRDQLVDLIKQLGVAWFRLRQILSAWRHQPLGAEAAQALPQPAG